MCAGSSFESDWNVSKLFWKQTPILILELWGADSCNKLGDKLFTHTPAVVAAASQST